MKTFSMKEYFRIIKNLNKNSISVFLGAGASIQSQIPSAYDMVWQFKRTLFCNLNNVSEHYFKDIQSLESRRIIQNYFDGINGYPCDKDPEEYSFYFEKCYPTILSRREFISKIVSNKLPSNGYLCLAALVKNNYIKDIFTTNFDSLPECAFKIIDPMSRCVTVSASLNPQIYIDERSYKIIKFHGDYLYDKIQNTAEELKSVEENVGKYAHTLLEEKQLLVIGYAGNDDSIITWLREGLNNRAFLSKGLYWCVLKGQVINKKVKSLLKSVEEFGVEVNLIEITDFDDLLYNMYLQLEVREAYIDNLGENKSLKSKIEFLSSERKFPFIKFNAFEISSNIANNVLECSKTSISDFDELREIIKGKSIVATLKKGNVYYITNNEENVIYKYIMGERTKVNFNLNRLNRENSVEIQLLYDLIFYKFSKNPLFKRVSKRKICLNDSGVLYLNNQYIYHEAINIYLNYYSNKLFLVIEPTIYLEKSNLEPLTQQEQIKISNDILSKRHNREFSEKLKFWQEEIYKYCRFDFSLGKFSFSFNTISLSHGGLKRKQCWPTVRAYEFSEPKMQSCYSVHVNQLVGLTQDGPYDCVYSTKRMPIQLAVLSCRDFADKIYNHLNSLKEKTKQNDSDDGFIKTYDGFQSVYRKDLIIPSVNSYSSILYDNPFLKIDTAEEYYNFLISKITLLLDKRNDFDVLIVYIPYAAKKLKISSAFDLHDAIKLFCANNQIKVQVIEDKSIDSAMKLKVKWGLSSGIYAKANGELWQPKYFSDDTAFIGISYSILPNGNYYVGCSQLFDSCGNGMRLIVNQLNDPKIVRKNPHMTKEDASYIVGNLLRAYYQSAPITKIKRVVVHKISPFIGEEIEGINLALSGIEKVELIQLQEFTGWRAIQFKADYDSGPHGFALKRGTTVQLDDNTLLLWTHGCVRDEELKGNLNYYKGGKGIPAPIIVKRIQGDSSGDMLVNELLMLTKMNWNSGDTLYKNLPVTIDFSKIVARMSKQNNMQYNRSYDFRYFI